MNGETLTGLLKKGQMILAQAGIKEAGLDAWLLLEYVTGKSRAYYFAYGEESVTESAAERYLELISRRAGHIPLQHLTHQAFFMGHEFYVDKNVLVPRQDTETLVESALECMKAVKNPYILDMCTGSGCILISILKERADAHGTGVDLSDEALKVAVRNARTLEVAEHAEFVQSNLFSEMQNIVYGTEYMKRTAVKDTVKMTECENSNRNYSRAYDMIISAFSTLFIYFFQIKPLNFLYFFCLKNKFRCIHRLLIDVDKSNFFIPKHFSMKFFCERYGEGSGKVQLFRCCADSQFFFQFPKCRFQWFVSCLDVSCRGSIKFSRKRILVL